MAIVVLKTESEVVDPTLAVFAQICLLILLGCTSRPEPAPAPDPVSQVETAATALAVGPGGDHYVIEASWVDEEQLLAGLRLPASLHSELVRRSADGAERWRRDLGEGVVWSLAAHPDGGVTVAGNQLVLGGDPGPARHGSLRGFDADGNALAAHALGGDGSTLVLSSLVTDDGTWAIGGASDPVGNSPPTHGELDAFAVRTQPDGTFSGVQLGGSEVDLALTAAAIDTGGLWMAGITRSLQLSVPVEAAQGGWDLFLVRLTPQDEVDHSVRLGGSKSDYVYSSVAHSNGSITLAGWSASPEFSAGVAPDDGYALYLLHYDPNTSPPARLLLTGCCSSYDQHLQLVRVPSGGLALAGGFAGEAFSISGSRVDSGAAVGGFLARVDDDGQLTALKSLGPMLAQPLDLPIGLAVQPDGRVCVAHSSLIEGRVQAHLTCDTEL